MGKAIVMISGNDPAAGSGGHSRYVRTQAGVLKRLGFEPHIFCAAPQNENIETEYAVIHRVASPFRPFRHLMMIGHAGRLVTAVENFLATRADPHLIHTFGVWGYPGAKIAKRLRARGQKMIHIVSAFDLLLNEARAKRAGLTSEHGLGQIAVHQLELWWVRWVIDRLESYGYRQADRIVVNYDSVRRSIAPRAPGVPILKMPYSSETAFLRGDSTDVFNRKSDRPTIVSVSRHSPRKGLNVLLYALARLRDEGVRFRARLVGRGPLLEAHRRLANELNLSECVALPGFVPDSFAELECADVFVLPSLEEGSGSLSLVEALQAGVAIVATNIDGIPEDVTNEDSALLVRPGDAGELSRALRRLLEDEELRRRLAMRGHEIFREKFLPEKWAEALSQLYAELGFTR